MSENPHFIADMAQAVAAESSPTVTLWNRLEGRPRADDFQRALKAEVRDALWFLTRQWQMGELRGSDAGSPVFAKLVAATTGLTKYRASDQPAEPFDAAVPLEAKAEAQTLPFVCAQRPINLDLRLLMGRKWLRLIAPIGLYAQDFKGKYRIAAPDPSRAEDATVCAHPESFQAFAAAADRGMDGGALYLHLKSSAAARAYDGLPGVSPIHHSDLDKAAAAFIAWFEALLYQPNGPDQDAWDPSRLEYRFACSAPAAGGGPGEHVLAATEYFQGHLDWYNFDVDTAPSGLGAALPAPADPRAQHAQTVVPAQVTFAGAPSTRWWAFEDARISFGDVKPDTTDIAKLLLIEFGLVYANDWFVIPLPLDAGSVTQVRGLMVTDVFGDRTWIEPAGGAAQDWHAFSLFTNALTSTPAVAARPALLLLPTVPQIQEGAPREEVVLIRDEMANMVWGIEKTIWLPSGDTRPGSEAASETLAYHQRLLNAPGAGSSAAEPEPAAPLRYQVQNSVPEHWIPFVPVHVEGSQREVELQRAGLPRILKGDTSAPVKVSPRTPLLREGLEATPRHAYFVHEEEVPRAGVQVSRSFQRTRWRDGRVVVWYGARKQTGRGEGASGLAFDQLVPNLKAQPQQ